MEAPVPAAVEEPMTDIFFNWASAEKKMMSNENEIEVILSINIDWRDEVLSGFLRIEELNLLLIT